MGSGPLDGIRVLELGSFIAGPFAGQLLADYGADVIKVEPQAGDAMRTWGVTRNGQSLWWPAIARNKRSITLDLRTDAGQQVIKELAPTCDVVVENFRPGTLDRWGIGYENLSQINPRIIVVHVSGFGQDGPYSDQAGFGSVAEAVGGIRFTTGSPTDGPSRSGISLGDSLASLFAVIGSLAAINERWKSGRGQQVDVAIYEAVFALMESTVADFHVGKVLRRRTGSVLPGVAPSNAYPTSDGTSIVMAANGDGVFARLVEAMQRSDLATDPRFDSHVGRGTNMEELDRIITQWTQTFGSEELLSLLNLHGVPAGRINTAETILADEHFRQRDMIVWTHTDDGINVPMNGVVPKFSRTPGTIRSTGPGLGEHTDEVLSELGAGADADLLERRS